MAEMTIRLRVDPQTKKKDIIVSLSSDEDAMPHEHEQQHRALVEKLIHGGIVKEGEIGQIIVEREESKGEWTGPLNSQTEQERQANQQGE